MTKKVLKNKDNVKNKEKEENRIF